MTLDLGPETDAERIARLEREVAHILAAISASDLLRETLDLLQDDTLDSPLVQQLDIWVTDEMTAVDPSHLLVTPMMCERIGRHVLSLAAAILERKLVARLIDDRKGAR